MKKVLFCTMMMASTISLADVAGEIVKISVDDGMVYLATDPRPTTKPSCATNSWWDYAFALTDDTSKATLSMALSAYAASLNVTVKSISECTVVDDMENLDRLVLSKT
ncbi:hypothetical protein [Microbulbifer sp. ZKSA002]|uniref:hypothetical protein n=1 Tax=Microbulbifer sp. ZKSA002 TaxID=3243388 RepID=UPI00403A6324